MKRLVGLDIGHSAVRAVVVQRVDNRWRLERHETVLRRDDTGQATSLPVVLSELDNLLNFSDKIVCASSSELNCLVRFVSTIPMPPDRLSRLLRLELSQHAGPDGELAADTMPVPLQGDELIHCCVLAQPAQVYDLLKELGKAKIAPDRIHFGAAALYNATIPTLPVQGGELALLLDIGAASSRVALFGENRLLACRQLAIGGDTFTEALQKEHNLPFGAAEQMKVKNVAPPPAARQEPAEPMAGSWISEAISKAPKGKNAPVAPQEPQGDDLFIIDDDSSHERASVAPAKSAGTPAGARAPVSAYDAIPTPRDGIVMPESQPLNPDLAKVADALYTQVISTHAWFKAQLHSERLDFTRIFISGGGSELSGLAPYLANRFRLAVEFLDPFVGFDGTLPQKPEEYVTALGLAVTAAPAAAKLDLLPEKLQRKRQLIKQLIWPYVAAACVLLSVLFTSLTWMHQNSVAQANLEAYLGYKAEYDQKKGELDKLEQESLNLSEDLRGIASRIFAGSDLLYSIRALKELAPKELWVTQLETVNVGKDVDAVKGAPAGAAPTTTVDTSIQRGSVDVSGLVKFTKDLDASEVNSFFDDYRKKLADWRPSPEALPLFAKMEVLEHLIKAGSVTDTKKKTASEERGFPFKIRYSFQPTQLNRISDTAPAPVTGKGP